jgi:hypothetical protein
MNSSLLEKPSFQRIAVVITRRLYAVQGRYTPRAGSLRPRDTLSKGHIVQGKTFGDASVGDTQRHALFNFHPRRKLRVNAEFYDQIPRVVFKYFYKI